MHENTLIAKVENFSLKQCLMSDIEGKEMQIISYASAVRSLIYAQVCTLPDLAFIVGMLSSYSSKPKLDHWIAIKWVMRYLQGTKDYMLVYQKSVNLEIIRYSDSDLADYIDIRKSISGYVFMLAGGGDISWKSFK